MMTGNDKELLAYAAKAANLDVWFPRMNGGRSPEGNRIILTPCHMERENRIVEWNPIEYSGDALWLAVKLRMQVSVFDNAVGIGMHGYKYREYPVGEDYEGATRRAIVRAAAEVGKAMP